MTDDEREELIRKVLAAASAADPDAQIACYSDDIVLEFPFGDPPGQVQGKDAIRAALTQAFQSFRFTLTPHQFHHAADSTVVEFTGRGTYLPSGADYNNTYIAVFQFSGDKVCRQREYYNTAYAASVINPS